jgi:hypothetical protein
LFAGHISFGFSHKDLAMALPIPSPPQIFQMPVHAINDKLVELRTAIGTGADYAGKKLALEGIMARMDPQGREIFENWLYGRVAINDTLLLATPDWQAYINADTSHRIGLEKKLVEIAEAQRRKLVAGSAQAHSETFSSTGFSAYFGKEGGGYWRGYEQLHGSNAIVGGMQIKRGELKAFFGPSPDTYTVLFRNLDLEFNDITDPIPSNPADSAAAGFFYELAAALNIGPPKSFATCVRWRSDLEVIVTKSREIGPHMKTTVSFRKP